jgi:hypothetical protein
VRKYRVTVYRIAADLQSAEIEVEAESPEAAMAQAKKDYEEKDDA